MRLANVDGRAVILTADDRGIDVATASGNKFGPSLPAVLDGLPEAGASWNDVAPGGPVRFRVIWRCGWTQS
jgi:hypothetical protein